MISVGEACLLGVVQGLTEFLPVSSDGHLALTQHWLTPMPAAEKLAVDVALHAGTLAALIVYFWTDLWAMARALIQPATAGYRLRWIGLLGLGTVPAALAGLTLKDWIAGTYDSFIITGVSFLITGTLLMLASRGRAGTRDEDDLGVADAATIGLFQTFALLPGLSRSGSTIAGAMMRGVRPDVAARFSFMLGIPAVAGAVVLEGEAIAALGPEAVVPLASGIVVAGITGLAAIAGLLRIVARGRLHWFAYYCWTLGAAVLIGVGMGRL